MLRTLSVGVALLALCACSADSGPPDIGRGSAEAPTTMLVDQNMNGVPRQSGTQRMVGASSWMPGAQAVTRAPGTSFGGTARPLEATGGQRY